MSEISVRLPDGKTLSVPGGSTVLAVAEKIGPGLAKAALAGRVDGRTGRSAHAAHRRRRDRDRDVARPAGRRGDPPLGRARDGRRGEAALPRRPDRRRSHRPQREVPVRLPGRRARSRPRTSSASRRRWRRSWPRTRRSRARSSRAIEARRLFSELGEELKVARLDDIPDGSEITLFRHGDFADLCRGPHVQRTDQIGAVKLLEVVRRLLARATSRATSSRRIYGTAFANKKELKQHLAAGSKRRAKRDHRRVGTDLEIFHLDPDLAGLPLLPAEGHGPLQRAGRLHEVALSRSTASRK